METYDEVRSNLKNLEYYNNKIEELLQKQIDMDLAKTTKENLEEKDFDIRLECLNNALASILYVTDCIANCRHQINMAVTTKLKIKENEDEPTATAAKSTTASQ